MEATPEAGIKSGHPQLTLDPHPATPYNPPMTNYPETLAKSYDYRDREYPPTCWDLETLKAFKRGMDNYFSITTKPQK